MNISSTQLQKTLDYVFNVSDHSKLSNTFMIHSIFYHESNYHKSLVSVFTVKQFEEWYPKHKQGLLQYFTDYCRQNISADSKVYKFGGVRLLDHFHLYVRRAMQGLTSDDYILCNLNYSLEHQSKRHPEFDVRQLHSDDLSIILPQLHNFLLDQLTLKQKIIWLIWNSHMSIKDISKNTGIDHSLISRYKNHKVNLDHLRFNNVTKLDRCYHHVLNYYFDRTTPIDDMYL